MPGFAERYGSDAIVDVRVKVTELHEWTTSAAAKRTDENVSIKASANLQFWPRFNNNTEKAIELDLTDIEFSGNLLVDGFEAYANVLSLNVDQITVPFSLIGD